MEKRPFGKTGLKVSVLGFGGAEVGYRGATRAQVEALLNGALDAGLNVIDTAECYVTSEELIGQAVGRRRRDFYLFSKCGHSHGYEDPDWNHPERLQASLDRSLRRLMTDALDLYQLHSCSKETLERGEVIDFMQRAKASGKTRFIGYSGDQEGARYAVGTGVFDALQISVSIADQEAVEDILPEAARRQMGVIAKRPIANAIWMQKSAPDAYYAPYWERLRKLRYEFLQDGAGQAVDTALRFTLSVPGVSVAIVGTQSPAAGRTTRKSSPQARLSARPTKPSANAGRKSPARTGSDKREKRRLDEMAGRRS